VAIRLLEYLVSGIHSQNCQHEYNLSNQDDIGIQTGPSGHFIRPEAPDFQCISADQKNDT
jgi:hypothetical protein